MARGRQISTDNIRVTLPFMAIWPSFAVDEYGWNHHVARISSRVNYAGHQVNFEVLIGEIPALLFVFMNPFRCPKSHTLRPIQDRSNKELRDYIPLGRWRKLLSVQLSKRTEILKSDRSSESSPISIKAMKEV
jgi:hypothetical protein